MNLTPTSRELIMVMGVQRSGTNALFDSLATDKTLSAFPEDIDSAWYRNFRLRPVSELAGLIERAPGRILLKPISETAVRSLADVAKEYRSYALRFVWIYRDPVNVFDSMRRQKWISGHDIKQSALFLGWQKRNEYALQFAQQHPDQIAIVRYEDLCLDPALFRKLTRWLALNCKSYSAATLRMGASKYPVLFSTSLTTLLPKRYAHWIMHAGSGRAVFNLGKIKFCASSGDESSRKSQRQPTRESAMTRSRRFVPRVN